jgi:hypothetical protein
MFSTDRRSQSVLGACDKKPEGRHGNDRNDQKLAKVLIICGGLPA